MYHDAIVVLGTKLLPDGQPSPEMKDRIEAAANRWKNGQAPMIIACGGQMDSEPCPEAEVMGAMLLQCGLPTMALRLDIESCNTLQNLQNAQRILSDFGGKSALIVTGDYHLPRVMAVCRQLGLRAEGDGVHTSEGPSRLRTQLREMLGWIEFRLGWQAVNGRPHFVQCLLRKKKKEDACL